MVFPRAFSWVFRMRLLHTVDIKTLDRHLDVGEGRHDLIELRDFARKELAAYKVPKRILSRASLERAPNGKANYQLIKEYAEEMLG